GSNSSPGAPRCDCGPHRDAGQMRWVLLDLGELPCLMDISKLNPGPSGEDADAVGQPRDVGSPCSAPVRAGMVDIGALSELPPTKACAPLARMQRTEKTGAVMTNQYTRSSATTAEHMADRLDNRDEDVMEGLVTAGAFVALADGRIEKVERDEL